MSWLAGTVTAVRDETLNARTVAYACGPTPFVESAANLLRNAGYDAARIKTKRFGPTGSDDGTGLTARCANCDNPLLRIVKASGRAWLDLRGMQFLQLTLP